MKKKFSISREDSIRIRFLDDANMKFITKSDHIFFKINVSDLEMDPSSNLLVPKAELKTMRTFIVQVGNPQIIDIKDLGIKEDFRESIDMI